MLLARVGGDQHRADDLSQRAWAGLWRSLQTGSYDPSRSAVTTYIYAIAYRTWLHDMRQRSSGSQQFQPLELDEERAGHSGDSPEAATHLAHAIDTVRAALGGSEPELSPDERDLLRAIGAGESDRTIAKRLGLAASTVNVRKQTVLAKLRRILAARGFRADSAERDAP
jgi:RNA polymerase sigma factor (sigma-70 family)